MDLFDKIRVTSKCSLVFDQNVDVRNRERPHVHVMKNNQRIASVSLESTKVTGYGMTLDEEDSICEFIDSHQRELIDIYNKDVNRW